MTLDSAKYSLEDEYEKSHSEGKLTLKNVGATYSFIQHLPMEGILPAGLWGLRGEPRQTASPVSLHLVF